MNNGICAIAKDEDNYINEWIDYHLGIGFDFIVVYMNNWRYSGKPLPKNVQLVPADGEIMQLPAYNHFVRETRGNMDFAAFIDIDEFIALRDDKNVKDCLRRYADTPGLFLNWINMGDSNKSFDGKTYSVIERFRLGGKQMDRLGKCLVNMRIADEKLLMTNPHHANIAVADPNRKYSTALGYLMENLNDDEPIQLYHYRNKTIEESYERRFHRPDACWDKDNPHNPRNVSQEDFLKDYFRMNLNETERLLVYNKWEEIKSKKTI
jgi:hypothetical protein